MYIRPLPLKPPSHLPHPTPLIHRRAPSPAPCATEQLPQLAISHTLVYMCQSSSPSPSHHPLATLCPHFHSLCPYSSSANRLICIIFLDSIHRRNMGVHPEETITQKDTCAPAFTAALFTIVRTWKQRRCPSVDKRIKMMWSMYTTEYHSAVKRNEPGAFVVMWMNQSLSYRVK